MSASDLDQEEVVRNCPLFRKATEDELAAVLECAEWITVDAGETVFQDGERSTALFLVGDGSVILHNNENAHAKPAGVVGHGQVFGGLSALADHPRTSTAKVDKNESSVLLKIDVEALKKQFDDHPKLAEKTMKPALKEAADQLERASGMIDALLTRD